MLIDLVRMVVCTVRMLEMFCVVFDKPVKLPLFYC